MGSSLKCSWLCDFHACNSVMCFHYQKVVLKSFFPLNVSKLLIYRDNLTNFVFSRSSFFFLVVAGTSLINADIVFVIDCSSSVPYPEYSREKSFVRSLGQYLNVQPDQSRAALVVYGSRPLTVIRLYNSQTFARFDAMLTKAPFLGGGRRYDKALNSTGDIFTNERENVPKIMLLFVAGKQAQVSGNT